MASIPQPAHATVQAIYRLHEQREAQAGHRPHLGASLIGHPCARYLWLSWRWADKEAFDGRMLRLFEAGRQFEQRIVGELRAIGVQVTDVDEQGRQWRVSDHGGHFAGSLDGAALGLPEAPATWHVLEFKTHNAKSFEELKAKGVRDAKPMHYAQMQVYMGLTGMTRAMYIAENKNTSELYSERVEFDAVAFERLRARALSIIESPEPPPRISSDPAWWQCKTCAMHGLCHGEQAPLVNCRTCAHSTPVPDGKGGWKCELRNTAIDISRQHAGCDGHRYIPLLLERIGEQVDATAEPDGNAAVRYRTPDGGEFVNGAPPHFASREIRAAQHKVMLADAEVQKVKAEWPGAEVVA
ncbi:oxidoreductase [Tepidimonas taiwanensis]|uniref:PD-(D/E)XK nuclease superfamily protein n=1 Tax=Tepidimonas taiwanensis TaxID=307486 RepID=A0A554XAW9_9BURK|nr:oxidoreductase [Tepidimonas taiwanensis]TSE32977.1 hypothetical protein Ttaiw_00838 [Tepidimonas taiwanensis]UBQ04488.1 oxidoreductase [Tepidimonas taiwanensis]